MNIFLASTAANTTSPLGGSMGMIVMLVIVFGLMYFMMMRPQKKQQQKRQEMLNQMKKGDHIVTIGGLHGVIDTINKTDKTVVIDSDGIYLTFNLGAIRTVEPTSAAAPATTDSDTQATDANEAAADDDNASAGTDAGSDDTSSDDANKADDAK